MLFRSHGRELLLAALLLPVLVAVGLGLGVDPLVLLHWQPLPAFTDGWAEVLALPWLFPDHAYPILIACAAIYHAGNHLMQPSWISLIGDHLPENLRGRYFGRRTGLAGVIGFTVMAMAGGVLHWFEHQDLARAGFATIFAVGGLGRLYSL